MGVGRARRRRNNAERKATGKARRTGEREVGAAKKARTVKRDMRGCCGNKTDGTVDGDRRRERGSALVVRRARDSPRATGCMDAGRREGDGED